MFSESLKSTGSGCLDLILFGTDHCSLCDEALDLLLSMPELAGQSVRVVDVVSDTHLMEAYGEQLPVLKLISNENGPEQVLIWPFDRATILAFLNQASRGG